MIYVAVLVSTSGSVAYDPHEIGDTTDFAIFDSAVASGYHVCPTDDTFKMIPAMSEALRYLLEHSA